MDAVGKEFGEDVRYIQLGSYVFDISGSFMVGVDEMVSFFVDVLSSLVPSFTMSRPQKMFFDLRLYRGSDEVRKHIV